MAAPRRFRPSDASRRTLWVTVGLAAFVIVDVVLVTWALSSAGAVSGEAASEAPSASITTPDPTPSPSPSDSEQASVTVAPTRVLAALDETTAWRATTGSCPETPATPEITADGGQSWTQTDAAVAGIVAVQDIDVQSADIASVLGLTEDECAPRIARTFVAGADYSIDEASVASTWFLDPSEPARINSPQGLIAAPCPLPVAIAPRNTTEAAVLCADQTIWSTADSGGDWVSADLVGALDLAETDSGYIAVAIGAGECVGVQVTEFDTSLVAGVSGCLPLDQSPSALTSSVAVAHAAGTTWLWASDRVWRSGDGGATWQ